VNKVGLLVLDIWPPKYWVFRQF